MLVIGIDGSPRDNGNTENLVKTILSGAKTQGAETKHFKLSKMKISPCLGCVSCRETGACNITDDMQVLYQELEHADAVVLGSPVYMGQMTAQLKGFLDRLLIFIKPDFSTRFKNKKISIMAFSQGNPDVKMFKLYFDYTAKMLALFFTVQDIIVASGNRNPGDLLNKPEVLEQAKESGKKLAK